MMWHVVWFIAVYEISTALVVNSVELAKDAVDNVIEDEITVKLSGDLLQSIEKKFQVDLEKSVKMVLEKIKLLLQNGTTHIQDGLVDLQKMLEDVKSKGENKFDECLLNHSNETSGLAEKALHQMVVCGYALIGHDPAQAVSKVSSLKNMINDGVKPIYEQKTEVYRLLKVCGHEHETLKKVVKCVISKSPIIKSAMMEITGKLIEGVVELTKLMAHGAMHEACLIEVIRTTEEEAMFLVNKVKVCTNVNNNVNNTQSIADHYINSNNATVIGDKITYNEKGEVNEMKGLVRKILSPDKGKELHADENKKKKLPQEPVENNNLVGNNLAGINKGDVHDK